MFLMLMTALADPTVDVAGGLGLFGPLRDPARPGPNLTAQVDVGGLLDAVPALKASANLDLGLYPSYGCQGCGSVGVWRFGLGPTWSTQWVDATLLARLQRFGGSSGSGVRVRPALQAQGRIPIGDRFTVNPYLGFDGVRFVDLFLGGRLGTTLGGDSTRTRPRQCEEGDLRELDEPVVTSSTRGMLDIGNGDIEFIYTGTEAHPADLDNPLKDMRGLLSNVLALSSSAQSANALRNGEAGLTDLAGRAQDIAGQSGFDWGVVPMSPSDLPGSLAQIELKIGEMAVDALIKKLKEVNKRYLEGAKVSYTKRTVTVECVPQQICMDGWWTDAGYVQRGDPKREDHDHSVTLAVPTGGAVSRWESDMWTKLSNWYNQPGQAILDEEAFLANDPCSQGHFDGETPEVDSGADGLDGGPSQADCAKWLRSKEVLESERRALVGSFLDLHHERMEWAEDQAKKDCDDAKAKLEFETASAGRQAEIARLAGDATSQAGADRQAARAENARASMEQVCGWASEVTERLGESEQAVERRPERLEEIEREKAELDAKIADCELLE